MTWHKAESGGIGKILDMIVSLRHLLGWLFSAFRSHEELVLENLALHQQLLALHAQRPRHRLTVLHKLFWVALRMLWSGWRKPLLLVTPRTVVNWHRAGFRSYWAWISRFRRVGGRKRVSKEIRALILVVAAVRPLVVSLRRVLFRITFLVRLRWWIRLLLLLSFRRFNLLCRFLCLGWLSFLRGLSLLGRLLSLGSCVVPRLVLIGWSGLCLRTRRYSRATRWFGPRILKCPRFRGCSNRWLPVVCGRQ